MAVAVDLGLYVDLATLFVLTGHSHFFEPFQQLLDAVDKNCAGGV